MNKVNEQINVEEITKGCRVMDVNDVLSLLQSNINVWWSWGPHALTKTKDDRMVRFAVNGNHHRGHVYIFVNGSDLFDVYFTTSKGTIKEIKTELYFDMLRDAIDRYVEYIPDYQY
ncbi:MAG: hypothetical protein ACOC22_04340 [bacterium]